MERHRLPGVIARCCQLKANIVGQDERDEGLRNILNFGHTFGHALESATLYKQYRHGEAVAIGMAGVLELSILMGLVSRLEADRVLKLLKTWELPVSFPAHLVEEVLTNLSYDKKVSGQKVTFILPLTLGQVKMESGIPLELLRTALQKIAQ